MVKQRQPQRFPSVQVVALDADPLLLGIGQGALGTAGSRIHWLRADLRDRAWPSQVGPEGSFDAALTATALHWLSVGDLVQTYHGLAGLLRPGGLFLNAEHLDVAPPGGRIAAAASGARRRLGQEQPGGGESWSEWWAAARAEPAFADLVAERERVFHDHPEEVRLTARFHEEALALAGFAETAVFWRYLDDTIVGGIR